MLRMLRMQQVELASGTKNRGHGGKRVAVGIDSRDAKTDAC
jgi:hypothetical protein